MQPQFGISSYVFRDARLAREHLVQIASHGFAALELFPAPAHFDQRDDRAVAELGDWLRDTGIALHSVHAPLRQLAAGGQLEALSLAAADERRRQAAVDAAHSALRIASRVPFRFLVVHLGVVPGPSAPPEQNRVESVRRSLEALAGPAADLGVGIAMEVIPNELSGAAALVGLIEDGLDDIDAGVCLDYGHAHLQGDLADAIETLSGHLWTTHVHDNRGQRDDHLVPFAGTIDWDAAMMETQKIGYDGMLMFEVAGTGDAGDVLRRATRARERLEQAFVSF